MLTLKQASFNHIIASKGTCIRQFKKFLNLKKKKNPFTYEFSLVHLQSILPSQMNTHAVVIFLVIKNTYRILLLEWPKVP